MRAKEVVDLSQYRQPGGESATGTSGPAQYLPAGTSLLIDQYTISRHLKCGGFGVTYLATDSLGRDVVIKECFPEKLAYRSGHWVLSRTPRDETELSSIVRSFVEEAHRLADVRHDGIVRVHQVFEENGTAYMAMDHVDGPDLLDMLEVGSSRPGPDDICRIARGMLQAIAFIHSAGILHRDISPDNILIGSSGAPVLIDFGAARHGTPEAGRPTPRIRFVKDGYSPPEFYVPGEEQGTFSDLYAFAATLHHVITGAVPADGKSRRLALEAGKPDPRQPLSGRFDGYPPGFLEAIDKALAIPPSERIQTAIEWMALLASWREGAPLPATEPVPTDDAMVAEPGVPAARISRSGPRALVAGVLVLAGVAGLGLLASRMADTTTIATGAPTSPDAAMVIAAATGGTGGETGGGTGDASGPAAGAAAPRPDLAGPSSGARIDTPLARSLGAPAPPVPPAPAPAPATAADETAPADAGPGAEVVLLGATLAPFERSPQAPASRIVEGGAPLPAAAAVPPVPRPAPAAQATPSIAPVVSIPAPARQDAVFAAPFVAETTGVILAAIAKAPARVTPAAVALPQQDAAPEAFPAQSDLPQPLDGVRTMALEIAVEPTPGTFGQPSPPVASGLLAALPDPAAVSRPSLDIVAPPPPAPGAVIAQQVAFSHWDVVMPFAAELERVRSANTIRITGVAPDADLRISGEWIAAGVVLYAFNGQPLLRDMPLSSHVLNGLSIDPDGFTRATVAYRSPDASGLDRGLLAVPVARQIGLADGTVLVSRMQDAAWTLSVATVGPETSGLRPGDILTEEISTGAALAGHEDLERVLDSLVAQDAEIASFLLRRNGQLETVAWPLARQ